MISTCNIEKASINFEKVWELSIQIVYDESFEIFEIFISINYPTFDKMLLQTEKIQYFETLKFHCIIFQCS